MQENNENFNVKVRKKSTVLTGSSARGCWVFGELQGRRRIDCLFIRGAIKTEINLMQDLECGVRGATNLEQEKESRKTRGKSIIEQIQYQKKKIIDVDWNDFCQ